MDYLIIGMAAGAFTVFLIVHVVVLRRISDRSVIPVFWMTYAACGVAWYALMGILWLPAMAVSLHHLFTILASWILYTLLVGNYFMGIFGVMESSIRMRVLGDIARTGQSGISRKAILSAYNHTKIVDKRLDRFVASGDIELVSGAYVSRKPVTFFLLPALVLRFFWWAYGRTNIVYAK